MRLKNMPNPRENPSEFAKIIRPAKFHIFSGNLHFDICCDLPLENRKK